MTWRLETTLPGNRQIFIGNRRIFFGNKNTFHKECLNEKKEEVFSTIDLPQPHDWSTIYFSINYIHEFK